jgi:branched-chain amino acid transport system ATP-binding protein
VARAGIAHVPEGRGTFTELTVHENLRLGAYTRRERSVRADVDRVAQWFPWIHERAGQQRARSRAASSRCSPSRAR